MLAMPPQKLPILGHLMGVSGLGQETPCQLDSEVVCNFKGFQGNYKIT